MAYGGSQARGLIGAVAAGLRHSHSNARSKPSLQPTPQLTATPDPSPTERDQGMNLQPHGSYSDSLTTAPRQELLTYPFILFKKFFFAFSRVTPTAYGGSQARGRIRAIAPGLHQSHSNMGSKPSLQPTPQLMATPDP